MSTTKDDSVLEKMIEKDLESFKSDDYDAKVLSARIAQAHGLPDSVIENNLGVLLKTFDRAQIDLDRGPIFCRFDWQKQADGNVGVGCYTLKFQQSPNQGTNWQGIDCVRDFPRFAECWQSLFLADVGKDQPQEILPGLKAGRVGNMMMLAQDKENVFFLGLETVLAFLEDVGSILHRRYEQAAADNPTGSLLWSRRNRLTRETYVSKVTGLNPERARAVRLLSSNDNKISVDLRAQLGNRSDELIAARMVPRELRDSEIQEILEAIDRVPKTGISDQLRLLSEEAIRAIEHTRGAKAWYQGHELARWFRDKRDYGLLDKVEPEKDLLDLGVQIVEEKFLTEDVDAICVWGSNHGPAVILNLNGIHVQALPARRATASHELCHSLIDRVAALPVAEIAGGEIPRPIEARARAFAAEFLLPQSAIKTLWDTTRSISGQIEYFMDKFNVSKRLAAFQIHNSDTKLKPNEREYIDYIIGFVNEEQKQNIFWY